MSLGEGEGEDKENNKKWHGKGGVQSKKVMTLTKIILITFFCDSIFIPSWFLIKL